MNTSTRLQRVRRARAAFFGGRARSAVIPLTIVVCIAVYLTFRGTAGEMAARAFAILIAAAMLWATEALPLFATAFVIIGLEILTLASEGGLADQITSLLTSAGIAVHPSPGMRPMSVQTFLGALSQDIVVLFMGGFLISAGITKHGVGRVLAGRFLHRFTRSPMRLIYAVLGMSAFLSMWMSNTATAAMMTAVIAPLVANVENKFRSGLVLAAVFGANMGGMATPISSPPNAIAYGALNAAGYPITFLRWMIVVVPLEILMLAATGWVLYRIFPPHPDLAIPALNPSEAMPPQGRITLMVLGISILLWLTSSVHGLTPGAVALLAAGALAAIGMLDSKDVASIDWGIIILMWGGLSLGSALQESGLAAYLGGLEFGVSGSTTLGLALPIVVVTVVMGTVMSNTVTAALLVPIAMALPSPENSELAMLAALACSFGVALPISTPPNLIAYSTGAVTSRDLMRVGSIISVGGGVLLLLGFRIMLPWAF